MGIFSALNTAVTGLSVQAYSLEQISGNIANSQTVGYKRTDVSFQDLVNDSNATRQEAAGVRVESRATNDVQGDIIDTASPTAMAINGDGFFIVGQSDGISDGQATFDDLDLYTRRGDFERDAEGYLVNGAGYFLKGLPVNQTTGNVVGTQPQLIQVTSDLLPARATTSIAYSANIPAFPFNQQADPTIPNSELLNPVGYAADPTTAGVGFVGATDEPRFLDQSISGGAITAYVASGADANLQLRWAKTSNAPGAETWNLFYLEDSNATGAAPAWRNTGTDFVFGADGNLTAPANSQLAINGATINGTPLQNFTIDFGANGLTQFDDNGGLINILELRQNGFPVGEFSSVRITDAGRVSASYTNGETVDLAEVTLVAFNADNRLEKRDGGAFIQTADSGPPILLNGNNIIASALESSNSEISEEFTKLIVTQQAYSANTRIITTADEMFQEVLNIVR
ncbi:MAG: flagellar hook-basal body complex protein [Pseudomonadota bacterium]